ncbi:hypothetical protein RI367_004468 [Sorochytrium milnesiophthora]
MALQEQQRKVDVYEGNNAISRGIHRHYTTGKHERSEQQLLAEQSLWVSSLPFSRWFLLPCAVIIQFCSGSLYAWSVYNVPIAKAIGCSENSPQITFYIAIGLLGLSGAVMGPWLERNGPRKAALIGTILFFIGGLGAALAVHTSQLWLLYLTYGLIGGCGLGLCYISPVSALQKWFPDRRGLSSGFAVCGFGAGSIAASPLQSALIASVGVPRTFIILHCSYFVLMMIATTGLRAPPPDYVVKGVTQEGIAAAPAQSATVADAYEDTVAPTKSLEPPTRLQLSLIESISTREYKIMYFMLLCNCIAGLVILSKLSTMVTGLFHKSAATAATIVSINGGFNLAGRIGFSLLSDFIGRKSVFLTILTIQVIALASLPAILYSDNYPAFLAAIWLLASAYGAGFGTIPAFLADMFGSYNIGALHGIILTAWAIGAIGGGLLFTLLNNTVKPKLYMYQVNFNWLLAMAALGLLITPFVRTKPVDRLLPPIPGEWTSFRAGPRLVRIGKFGVKSFTDAQLLQEWRDMARV